MNLSYADLLGACMPDALPATPATIAGVSTDAGAYALILRLDDPVVFSRKAIGTAALSSWFVYAGSARGSGGIRARLARHFGKDKALHWHVDELTIAAAHLSALVMPGGCECEIVRRLLDTRRFVVALRGFGSSDCRSCPSHLLRPG